MIEEIKVTATKSQLDDTVAVDLSDLQKKYDDLAAAYDKLYEERLSEDYENFVNTEVAFEVRGQNKLTEEIKELTKFWTICISGDHHKDRDCYFYIERKFSYNWEEEIYVYHDGYIVDYWCVAVANYIDALRTLKSRIQKQILEFLVEGEDEEKLKEYKEKFIK